MRHKRVTAVKGVKEETAGEGGGKEDRGMEDKTELKHEQLTEPS